MLGVSDVVAMVFPRERYSEEERKSGVKAGVSGGSGWAGAGKELGLGLGSELKSGSGWVGCDKMRLDGEDSWVWDQKW